MDFIKQIKKYVVFAFNNMEELMLEFFNIKVDYVDIVEFHMSWSNCKISVDYVSKDNREYISTVVYINTNNYIDWFNSKNK